MQDLIVGPLGSAERAELSGVTGPSALYTLDGWLLDCCVGAATPWGYYFLSLAHLRQLEGMPPVELEFPEATHELLLRAVDSSERVPDRRRPQEFRTMSPVNMLVQFSSDSDEQAGDVLRHVAQALVDKDLPVEPVTVLNSYQFWIDKVRWFADHVRTTGCKGGRGESHGG